MRILPVLRGITFTHLTSLLPTLLIGKECPHEAQTQNHRRGKSLRLLHRHGLPCDQRLPARQRRNRRKSKCRHCGPGLCARQQRPELQDWPPSSGGLHCPGHRQPVLLPDIGGTGGRPGPAGLQSAGHQHPRKRTTGAGRLPGADQRSHRWSHLCLYLSGLC